MTARCNTGVSSGLHESWRTSRGLKMVSGILLDLTRSRDAQLHINRMNMSPFDPFVQMLCIYYNNSVAVAEHQRGGGVWSGPAAGVFVEAPASRG